MTYYIGRDNTNSELLGTNQPRYFYAIRRDDDGLLYFAKVDQMRDQGSITINNPGLAEDDFTDFSYGVDYFDGRLEEDHSRPHPNLQWDQYRWDDKNMYYYINSTGELVVRINQSYTYPPELIIDDGK